jgi:hypothetical protein
MNLGGAGGSGGGGEGGKAGGVGDLGFDPDAAENAKNTGTTTTNTATNAIPAHWKRRLGFSYHAFGLTVLADTSGSVDRSLVVTSLRISLNVKSEKRTPSSI